MNLIYYFISGVETSSDTFHLSCDDGVNKARHSTTFSVTIAPVNDELPKVFVNDFVVEEGRVLLIDLPILNVIDADRPPDLITFKVSRKLSIP